MQFKFMQIRGMVILIMFSLFLALPASAEAATGVVRGMAYMYPNYNCSSSHRFFFGNGCGNAQSECRGPTDAKSNYTITLATDTTDNADTRQPTSCSNEPSWDFDIITSNNIALQIDNSSYTYPYTTSVSQHGFKINGWSRYVTANLGPQDPLYRCTNTSWNNAAKATSTQERQFILNNYDFEEHAVAAAEIVTTGGIPLVTRTVTTAGGQTITCSDNNFFFFNDYGYPNFNISGSKTGYVNQPMDFTLNANAGGADPSRTLTFNGDIYVTTDTATAPGNCPATKIQTNLDGTRACSLSTKLLSGRSDSMTAAWTPPSAGTYYLSGSVFDTNGQHCTNNPFCNLNGLNTCAAGQACINCPTWATQYSGPYDRPFESSCSNTFQITVTPAPPTISSLQINNADTNQTKGFTGTNRFSGLTEGQGGSNWLNPATVKLNAAKGSGDIKFYATAFYDKLQGQSTNQTALTSLIAIESQIIASQNRGFILAYAAQDCSNQTNNCLVDNTGTSFSAGKHYVYTKTSGWVDISNDIRGRNINNSSGQLIMTVYPLTSDPISTNGPNAKWQVRFDKNFGNKNMYTPGFVIDGNNLSKFETDL